MSPGASGWGGAVLPSLKHRGFCTLPFQARLRFVGRYLPCVASLIIGFCLAPPALFLLPGVATQTRCSDGTERHLQQGLTVTRPAESGRMARIAHKRVVHRVGSRPLVNARFSALSVRRMNVIGAGLWKNGTSLPALHVSTSTGYPPTSHCWSLDPFPRRLRWFLVLL